MAKQVTTIRLEEDVSRACRERFVQTGESRNALVDLALREYLGMGGTSADQPRDKAERELVNSLLSAWRTADDEDRAWLRSSLVLLEQKLEIQASEKSREETPRKRAE